MRRHMRHASILALATIAFGCGSRSPNVVVRPAPVAATATMSTPAPAGGSCQSTISVGVVRTRAGCEIDERVSGQTAVLSHACGDGPASASFADATFQGGVTGGELDIAIETIFQFTDGCTWRTKQRIQGMLGGGPLAYTYEEQPDPGQRGCAQGCLAQAQVTVY